MDLTKIRFEPVYVKGGRKFHGFGYVVDIVEYTYRGNYYNNSSLEATEVAKIWEPTSKTIQYATLKYCKPAPNVNTKLEKDRQEYIDKLIENQINWCRKKSLNEEDALQFARNCLNKYHPELKELIDACLPDRRDVVKAVEDTLRWAMNLKTQSMRLYGKNCKGGRSYSKTNIVRKAFWSLQRRRFTELDGFKEAWIMFTTLFELPNFGVELNDESNAKDNSDQAS